MIKIKYKWIKETLKAIVGICLIFIIFRKVDMKKSVDLIKDSKLHYIFFAFASFGFSRICEGMRLHIIIEKYGFKLYTVLKLLMITVFLNNLSSPAVGDGYKIIILKKRIKNWRIPIALIFIERLLGLTAIAIFGAAYMIINHAYFARVGAVLKINWNFRYNLIGICLAAFAIVSIWFLKRLRILVEYLSKFMIEIKEIISRLYFIDIAWIIILSILSQLLIAFTIYILVHSFHFHLKMFDAVFILFLVSLGTYVPISIGSLGVREGIIVISLTILSISQPVAAAVALICRLIMYVYAFIGGIVFMHYKNT